MIGGVGEKDFRRAMGTFATGVGVVTCVAKGMDHAMTANAISSVSLRPPLLLVAVERTTRFWEAVSQQRYWAVSVLADAARDQAAWLATSGRPLEGQLDRVPFHRSSRGIALLDDALAHLECRTYQTVPAGDHEIFIGEVESVTHVAADAAALVYWRSGYRQLEL